MAVTKSPLLLSYQMSVTKMVVTKMSLLHSYQMSVTKCPLPKCPLPNWSLPKWSLPKRRYQISPRHIHNNTNSERFYYKAI